MRQVRSCRRVALAVVAMRHHAAMPTETEFFQWWIPDEITGKLRKTRHKMTRETAQERHPGCEPYPPSREVSTVFGPGEAPANVRPAEGLP